VKQQHGISRHEQNYFTCRLFSYRHDSYQQWKHCPSSAGLYKGHNRRDCQYDTAMHWAAIPSKHRRTNPVCQIAVLIFSLPLANSHHHSELLDKTAYIHRVSQRCFNIMSQVSGQQHYQKYYVLGQRNRLWSLD